MRVKKRFLTLLCTVILLGAVIHGDGDLAQSVDENKDLSSGVQTPLQPIQTISENKTNAEEADKKNETETKKESVVEEVSPSQEESQNSFRIFFILCVLLVAILMVYLLIKFKFHYLPESIAIVILGSIIGGLFQIFNHYNIGKIKESEELNPTIFFLVMLPPIIFESGYSLHKGNFFSNLGSIVLFAVVGTAISAFSVGAGLYVLGQAKISYELTAKQSFGFGALISAVDPVATLAIFSAIDVHPTLYMLVFGESVLNDAVSIVMTDTIIHFNDTEAGSAIGSAIGDFFLSFSMSGVLGVVFALVLALLLKHMALQKTPSLEFCTVCLFAYGPYFLAEGLHLSGIMAILSSGIVMSHYAHYNLSFMTQVTVQQVFRTFAFLAESCVFAYLGMAIFSFTHSFQPAFIVWSIILCLAGRGLNIGLLTLLANRFRQTKITPQQQFIMWFSGLRGAIAFALALHLPFEEEIRKVLVSTTLVIVLFTIVFMGGSTNPMIKFVQYWTDRQTGRSRLESEDRQNLQGSDDTVFSLTGEDGEYVHVQTSPPVGSDEYMLSKTVEFGRSMNIDDVDLGQPATGWSKYDEKYFIPFFRKRFTQQEIRRACNEMHDLTEKWHTDVETGSNMLDENEDEHSL